MKEGATKTPRLLSWLSVVLATGTSGADYELGVDSLPQEGVPKGRVTKHTFDDSRIFTEAAHDYWVYVPAQYTGAEPAAVMVFQDGQGYVSLDGPVRAPTVFDNLIHKREMPVTIGVFINPGRPEANRDQRAAQYVPIDDTYARFLLEEILPLVGKDYNLVDDASGRAICGMSDGGLSSFTAAWHRPDAFSKVVSHVGSYTRLRGGSEYPYLIRKTRGNPKPIRVFIQGGTNDINLAEGNWTLANLAMASALLFARYDHRVDIGTGGHSLLHGGAIFPDTLRWLWRDYPGVDGTNVVSTPDAVLGEWDIVTNIMGDEQRSVLAVGMEDGALTGRLRDDKGEVEITAIRFEDGILSYEYDTPKPAWLWEKEKSKGETTGDQWTDTISVWLQVTGDRFTGASSSAANAIDDPVVGQRRAPTGP